MSCLVTAKTNNRKPTRLIVFDVEGILIPKRRYLLFTAAKKLSLWRYLQVAMIGFLYELGLTSLGSALRRIFRFFQGLTVDDLFRLYRKLPLMPETEEVFKKLGEAGYKTALISSGIPTPFVEDLADRLGADYARGLELEETGGRLTGEISGDVLKPDGKALVLKEILRAEGLSPQHCAVVADDRNNLPMFPLCAVKIGYNPDFLLSAKSDYAVKGNLSEILPFLTEYTAKAPHPVFSKRELLRETIHAVSFFIPFVCIYFLNRHLVALIIFLFALLYVASELARLQGTSFPILSALTRRAAINPELYGFAADPTFFALGITLVLILFPESISYASIAVLTLGDSFASISGKTLGKTVIPFNKGKKLEGSIFGFFFAFMGALFFVNPTKALIGAFVGMLTESLPLPVSDNLTVPLACGLAMTIIP